MTSEICWLIGTYACPFSRYTLRCPTRSETFVQCTRKYDSLSKFLPRKGFASVSFCFRAAFSAGETWSAR